MNTISPTTATRPPPARRLTTELRWLIAPCLTLVMFAGCWQAYSMSRDRQDRWMFPTPGQITRAGLGDATTRAQLTNALAETVLISMVGLAIATIIGVTMAAVMIQSSWLEHALQPIAILLQSTPLPVLAPIFAFWWGYGFTSRCLVCVLIALFPIVINTVDGMRAVDGLLHDFLTVHHASRWTRLWRLQLPAALPNLFTGERIAGTNAVIGAVVADAFFRQGPAGLGVWVEVYRENLRIDQALAAAATAITLGGLVFGLITLLQLVTVGRWAPRHWNR
ncbi:MAG: ABC transporter permease [Mycobacteriales bacterium]